LVLDHNYCFLIPETGLAWGTDEGAIRDAFSSFGEVTEGIVVISLDLFSTGIQLVL
jgi:hypothetical protein